MRVALSTLATADLWEIRRYVSKLWGAEQSRRYLAEIRAVLKLLGDLPYAGQAHEGADVVEPGLRRRSVGRHIIFYRLAEDCVNVSRILHSSQDAGAHLF